MKIPFEKEYREKYYKLLDKIFDSNFLSEGEMVKTFEKNFEKFTNLKSVAYSNGGMGLLSLLEFVDVKGKDVIVPTNTFMATALAVKKAGGNIIFADCSKKDLCLTVDTIKQVKTDNTKAVILVHIGGHLAFESFEIAEYCKKNGIALIEDCAHAHGATYKGKSAGSFGIGGSYSFYATKTMPLGEGGMVVSQNTEVIEWCKKWRNYGKFEYKIHGFNARMNEMTAAFGIIQLERLPNILKWKRELAKKYDKIFENRVYFPDEMISGYYKYIIFDYNITQETGQVFGDLCHEHFNIKGNFENSIWIKNHHKCPPMFYGWENANLNPNELKNLLIK